MTQKVIAESGDLNQAWDETFTLNSLDDFNGNYTCKKLLISFKSKFQWHN